MKSEILFDDDGGMDPQNAPYYRIFRDRYAPLGDNYYLAIEFTRGYFDKLEKELESAGYEVTFVGDEFWYPIPIGRQAHLFYAPPIGYFNINDSVRGEGFAFFAM
jgi:hypothetical protein